MEEHANLDFKDVFNTLQQNLLDMGLRNNLLNFKEVARTVHIMDINLMDLYDSVVLNSDKLAFIPKENSDSSKKGIWFIPIDLHDDKELQLKTNLTEKELQKRLFSLFQYYKTSTTDLGYNNLFLALGFLKWKQDRENSYHMAPLVLVPIEISRSSVAAPFKIKWTGEDISLNLSLRHKLSDLGIDLPIHESIESKNDFIEYFDEVNKAIKHKAGWEVVTDAFVSTFSFKKFVMYKDLTLENWDNVEDSEIGRLFGLNEVENFDSFDVKNIDKELEPLNTYNVVDADSSQIAVIEDAKKGHSLVVEGPPGTGKSQTIVNLISELLANDNKVLFVSEKMAALEVVKKRMDNIGLGDYYLELHSNKTRKTAMLEDLNKTLLKDKISVKDFEDYDKLKQSIDYLDNYMDLIRSDYADTSLSIYDIIGLYEYKYQELERLEQRIYKFKLPSFKDYTLQKQDELFSNIDEIAELYNLIYPIKDNSWNYTDITYISPDDIDNINSKTYEIDNNLSLIDDEIESISASTGIAKPKKFGELKKFIQQVELSLSNNDVQKDQSLLKELVDSVSEYQNNYDEELDFSGVDIDSIKKEFDALLSQIDSVEISSDIMFRQNAQSLLDVLKENYIALEKSPVRMALNDPEILQKFHSFKANKDSFTKFMNKEYKRSKNELKGYYIHDVDDETITSDYDNLFKYNDEVNNVKNKVLPFSSSTSLSIEQIIYDLEKLIKIFNKINDINQTISKLFHEEIFITLDELKTHVNIAYKQKHLKEFIDKNDKTAKKYFKSWNNTKTDIITLKTEYENLSAFTKESTNNNDTIDVTTQNEIIKSNKTVETLNTQIIEDYNYLNEVLHFKNKLSKKNINSLEITEFNQSIQQISKNIYSLGNWSQFNTYCEEFNNKYTKDIIKLIKEDKIKPEAILPLYQFNFANNILIGIFKENKILQNFNSNIYQKNIELFKQLDQETIKLNRYRVKQELDQKRPDLKMSISPKSELGMLIHEMNKKRNHKSIRQILKECPNTITEIKPCFLMSPISIAQYLDTKTYESYFDYIIFDEASQVKIEDAIGALLRGKHYIIMGDTKQLPPTAFFDVETNMESETEEVPVQDVESILHFCKTVLPYRMLKCHYRSRHESLIAVSNLEFYNNDLFIYPSPMMNSEELGLKLHYNPNNIYDKGKTRQNKNEAQEVVQQAIQHFQKYGYKKSLGIGTFSVAQKQAILEEIETQLKDKPELDPYFNTTGDKSFFVKNIENIQGDERDVMLISIGYGFDNNHELSMNFGPLNNDGGERRLNVLTTRAKEKCVVFSNFKSADMHISARTPKGVQVLKTFLYYAEHGKFPSNYVQEDQFNSNFEKSVYNYLISEGFKVEKHVGCAGYKIDLAIVNPDDEDEFVIAIECDGSKYHTDSSARERDRIRQNILEGLGWSFHRLWSTEWYLNRQNAKQNLTKAIYKALKEKEKIVKEQKQAKEQAKKESKEQKITKKQNKTIEKQEEKITLNDTRKESTKTTQTKDEELDDFDKLFKQLDEEDEDDVIIQDINDINKTDSDESDEKTTDESEILTDDISDFENDQITDETEEYMDLDLEDDDNLGTESIEDKIEYEPVELKEDVLEKEYEYYDKTLDFDEFYSIDEKEIMPIIEEIIHIESPIHRDEIYNRLKKAFNIKATKKFKTTIDSMINKLLKNTNKIYVKNNFYYEFNKEIVVRKRNKPNIDYISDDEIIEAITQVLILNSNVKVDKLPKQVSKLLGFKSLSAKTANKLNEVINFLRFSDKIIIDSDNIVLLKTDDE